MKMYCTHRIALHPRILVTSFVLYKMVRLVRWPRVDKGYYQIPAQGVLSARGSGAHGTFPPSDPFSASDLFSASEAISAHAEKVHCPKK